MKNDEPIPLFSTYSYVKCKNISYYILKIKTYNTEKDTFLDEAEYYCKSVSDGSLSWFKESELDFQ